MGYNMENHSNEPLILFCHDNIPAVDSNLIHPHAAIHPGTIKKWLLWLLLLSGPSLRKTFQSCSVLVCEQAAVIKMTSAPWKLCIMSFPQGKLQAYSELYFTPDNSKWILVPQLRPEMCSTEQRRRAGQCAPCSNFSKQEILTTGRNSGQKEDFICHLLSNWPTGRLRDQGPAYTVQFFYARCHLPQLLCSNFIKHISTGPLIWTFWCESTV